MCWLIWRVLDCFTKCETYMYLQMSRDMTKPTKSVSTQRRLRSDWMDVQADLSPGWAHSHFVGFVMSRLKCSETVNESWQESMYFSSSVNSLQTRVRSHPMGLDVWYLVGPFFYFHTSCVRTVKTDAYKSTLTQFVTSWWFDCTIWLYQPASQR